MSSYEFDDTFDHGGLPSSPDPLDDSSPGLGSPPNPLPPRHISSPHNSEPSYERRASAAVDGTPRRHKVQLEDFVLKTPPAGKSSRDQARCPSRSPTSTSISRENMLSPWRIRVTVHAERESSDGDEEQPQESSFDELAFRRTTRATTTTVPLKGLGSSSPPTVGKETGRRRTRRSDLTPGRRKSTGPVTRASRRKTQGDLAEGLGEGLSDIPRRGRGRPRKSTVPAQLGDGVNDAEVRIQDVSFDSGQEHQGPSLLDFASSVPRRTSQDRSLHRLPADPEPASRRTQAHLRKSGTVTVNTTGRTLADEEEKSEESDDGLIVTTPRRRPRHSLLSLVSSPHKERFDFNSPPVGTDDDSPAPLPVASQRKRSKVRRQAMSPLKIAVDRDAYLDEPSIDSGSRQVGRERSSGKETAVLNDISLNRLAERPKSSSFNQTSSSQPSTEKGKTFDNLAQYPSSPPVRVAPLSPRLSDSSGLDSENDAATGLQSSQYLPSPEPSPTKSAHFVSRSHVRQSPVTVEEDPQQDESGQEEEYGGEIDYSASVHDSMILDSEGFSMVSIESLTQSIPEILGPSSEMNEPDALHNEAPMEESTEAESAETKEGDDQSQTATPTQPLKISSSGLTTPEPSSSTAPTPAATKKQQTGESITAPPHSLITPDETPPPREPGPYSPAEKGLSEVSRLQVLQPTVAQSPALAAVARTEQRDETSHLNSSPPARILGYAAQVPPLAQTLSRAGQQQTPSIAYSSPKLPPPLPRDAAHTRAKEPTPKHGSSSQSVTEARTPGTEPTPKLTRVRRANLALQSAMLSPNNRDPVLGSPFRSPTAARRNSAPSSSPLATKANPKLENVGLFEGFSHSTQRELRAGLKYGEELARRGSEDLSALQVTSAPLGENDVFRDEASRLSKNTAFEKKSEAYALAMPGGVKATHRSLGRLQGHGVAIRSPLTAHLLQVDKDDDAMSWKADTPVKIFPADSHVPVEARQAGIDFFPTQLPGPAKTTAKSSMYDERELQWQREREQVSRQIDMANQSQVIVIDDSETDGDSSDTSNQQIPRNNEVVDDVQVTKPVEEGNVNNGGWFALPSFLQAKKSPHMPEQTEKRVSVKPRRSKLPSPWRRDRQIVYSDEVEEPSQVEGVTEKASLEEQQQGLPAKTSILDEGTDTDTDSEAEASVPAITTARRWMGEMSELNLTALLGLSSSPAKSAAETVDPNNASVSTEAEHESITSASFSTSGSSAAGYEGQSVVTQNHIQKIPLKPSHESGLGIDEDTAGSHVEYSSQVSHGSDPSSVVNEEFPDSSLTESAELAPFAKRPLVATQTPAPSPAQAPPAIEQPAVVPKVALSIGLGTAPSKPQPGRHEVAQSAIPHTASKATPATKQHPLLTTGEWKKSHWQLLDKLYMATPVSSRAVLIPQPAKFTAPRGPTPTATKSPAGAILFARPFKDKEYALMPGEIEFETVDIFMEVMREANSGNAVFTVEYVARRLFALIRGAKIRRELKERETAAKGTRETVSGVRR